MKHSKIVVCALLLTSACTAQLTTLQTNVARMIARQPHSALTTEYRGPEAIAHRVFDYIGLVGIPVIGGSLGLVASGYVAYDQALNLQPTFVYYPWVTAALLALTSLKPLKSGLDYYAQLQTETLPQPIFRQKIARSWSKALYYARIMAALGLPFMLRKEYDAQIPRRMHNQQEEVLKLALASAVPIITTACEGLYGITRRALRGMHAKPRKY